MTWLVATAVTVTLLQSASCLASPTKIVTVYAGKGGVGKTTLSYELAYSLRAVLVDLDWDAGGASGMWGYNTRERQPRSPLVDALGSDRTPSIVTEERRPDLVPSHPDLAVNQPEPADMRDRLAKWAVEMGTALGSHRHTSGRGSDRLRRPCGGVGGGHAGSARYEGTRRSRRHPG